MNILCDEALLRARRRDGTSPRHQPCGRFDVMMAIRNDGCDGNPALFIAGRFITQPIGKWLGVMTPLWLDEVTTRRDSGITEHHHDGVNA